MLSDDMEFRNSMEKLSDRQILETVAIRVNAVCKRCEDHETRIKAVELTERMAIAIGTGTGAAVSFVTTIFVRYLLRYIGLGD
jgi:hypothetical protein